MINLRLRLVSSLYWIAERIAPRHMRPVLHTATNVLYSLPRQIDTGQEGGVILIPWSINERGQDLSERQFKTCTEVAYVIREMFEGRMGSNNDNAQSAEKTEEKTEEALDEEIDERCANILDEIDLAELPPKGEDPDVAARQKEIHDLWRMTAPYTNRGQKLPMADQYGHRTRFSDSSYMDEICVCCGANDSNGVAALNSPCPKPVPDDVAAKYNALMAGAK